MKTADLLRRIRARKPNPLRGYAKEYRPTLNTLRENEHPHPETTLGETIHKARIERIKKEIADEHVLAARGQVRLPGHRRGA